MNSAQESWLLMRHHRHGMLATHSKKLSGYPFGSVVPYVLDHQARPVILISTLAEHTKNIDHNEKVSLLVTEGGNDVQAEARVTFTGDCARLNNQESPKARYLRYFPRAAGYFETHDFFFYAIELKLLRFIGGFGKIHWVEAEGYAPPSNRLDSQETGILEHMNKDHRDNLFDYCRHFHNKVPGEIEMIGIDCDGFDLMADSEILRFDFATPVTDAAQSRTALDSNIIERRIGMQSKVTEIAPGTYRISTFHPDYKIQFNQFLIKDDEPFLMHTGFKRMFQTTLEGVASIMDPVKLRWIGFSHFESDERGALNEWLAAAPRGQAVCSFVSAMVMVNDFADRAARPLADSEVLQTGKHRIRFLSTPHVPHAWDAGLFFDETERTLLCSDLFFQPGNPEPLIESGIVERA